MARREPESRVRLPILRQSWRDVLFVHWSYPEAEVASHLPTGFGVDTFDGMAWVALSAFRVGACGLGPLPPSSLWAFPETNLRTYVIGPDGTDGIWFLSIEAQTFPVTLAARLVLGAPYHYAGMEVHSNGTTRRYVSRRPDRPEIRHDVRVRTGPPLAEADRVGLIDWLTGRWRSWSTRAGLAICSPVEHKPWPLHHAELLVLDETISGAAGLLPPSDDPLVHLSPGVEARFGRPHLHRRGLAAKRVGSTRSWMP